jgi:hypothetical protein
MVGKLPPLHTISFRRLITLFPVIACLHEFEEWNILKWHRAYNSNVPVDIVNLDIRTVFILINILIILWTIISLIPKSNKRSAFLFMPLMLIGAVNGFEHLFWLIRFGVYAPGFVFGFLFEMPLITIIFYRMIKERLIVHWYAGVFGVITIAGVVNLLMLDDAIDPVIVSVMKMSPAISHFIWN